MTIDPLPTGATPEELREVLQFIDYMVNHECRRIQAACKDAMIELERSGASLPIQTRNALLSLSTIEQSASVLSEGVHDEMMGIGKNYPIRGGGGKTLLKPIRRRRSNRQQRTQARPFFALQSSVNHVTD
ncbi:MAG: hypothetical protein Q4B17_13460 [Lautropia sp.]|nr:hypothetical protein [Lautropia sp.]